jgi:hypothetical protein
MEELYVDTVITAYQLTRNKSTDSNENSTQIRATEPKSFLLRPADCTN